jgi:phenylacetate-CoA ligase
MPDLIKPFAKHVVFPLVALRERSSAPRHLKEMEKTQYDSPAEIRRLQFERLKKLLIHAYKNCPFYARRFDKFGLEPTRIQSPDDIRKIPVLTKQEIQKHRDDLRARNYSADMLVPNKTGGSTGSPLYFYLDADRLFSRQAATFRHNRWAGWDIGVKTASLWGHREDISGLRNFKARLRNILLDRRIVLDTSGITPEKLTGFKRELKRFRPELYIAYANSMYLFAKYLKETNSTDHHRPKAIITSAELLDPERRGLIESVFGCRVFDRYGSRETSVIASECEKHTGLHIGAEAFFLEFIKDNRPAPSGQLGKIIITDLLNYGMPFIRYQIEDAGVSSDELCSCGRGLPLMKMAAGRVTDFLVTPDRRIISGASLTIYLIANTPGVAQAQLIQEKIDEIRFRIVKGEGFGEKSLEYLEEEFPKFFGSLVKYQIEFVDQIPLESSGKYRFSISKVDPAEIF